MGNMIKSIPYLMLNLVVMYVLPYWATFIASQSTISNTQFLLFLIPALVSIIACFHSFKYGFKVLYPIMVFFLSIPLAFFFMAAPFTAFIIGLVALTGNSLGAYIHRKRQ